MRALHLDSSIETHIQALSTLEGIRRCPKNFYRIIRWLA